MWRWLTLVRVPRVYPMMLPMKQVTQQPGTVLGFIQRVLPRMQSQQERDDQYLAESVDIYDLERRMREIDSRGRNTPPSLPLGLGLR